MRNENIKNILICGLGAIGSIYAEKILNIKDVNLKILVDKTRLDKYTNSPLIFNGKELTFNYTLPETEDFQADLIIIATKFIGLYEARENIKNFKEANGIKELFSTQQTLDDYKRFIDDINNFYEYDIKEL